VQRLNKDGWGLTSDALVLLQAGVEAFVTDIFEDGNTCALHVGRQTLTSEDIQLVKRLRLDTQ
jgi:histone H3/H4